MQSRKEPKFDPVYGSKNILRKIEKVLEKGENEKGALQGCVKKVSLAEKATIIKKLVG